MNRVRKHIGVFATSYGIASGVLAALLCLLLAMLLFVVVESRKLYATHQRLATQISGITREQEDMLASLNRLVMPVCDDATLVRLRTRIFASRHIRDVGIFDLQNRLVCTSSEGLLASPLLPLTPALREIRNGVDQSIWFNAPILLGQWRYRAMVMQQGRFNVVVNQDSLSALLRDVDVLGLQLADALPGRVFVSGRLTPYWSRYFDEQTALKRPLKGFDWTAQALVRTDYIPGTPWVVQSYLTLPEILQRQGLILLLVAVAASLIGLLVTGFVTPILARQKRIGARIRNLLEEGCVQCYYQPIVALGTRRWVGCEVLMRIRDGDEQISPQLALPEIEKQGLGWVLDSFVLQQSLRELAQALPPTDGFKVAVNLFPDNIQFRRLDALISPLQAMLCRPDLQLGLEIVEQSYDDTVVHEIAALRQAGYQVSVDDFGTGYSNLGRVKRMAPDVLKIDRSFVFEMEDLSLRSSLIPEIVSIARAIGSSLVAEGIENELQAEQLASMGVEYGQGYLFARPLPIDAFAAAFAAQLRWQQGTVRGG